MTENELPLMVIGVVTAAGLDPEEVFDFEISDDGKTISVKLTPKMEKIEMSVVLPDE